jgi:PIN like domain
MQLDPLTRDYRAFVEDLIEALGQRDTRVYLDTSVLMWLVSLGAQARAQFMAWCSGRAPGSVRVPVWAAHELHHHLISGTVRANVQATLNDVQRRYEEFVFMAAERADDSACRARGFADRTGYVGELRRSSAVMENLARVVQPDDSVLRAASEEVITFVNAHLLQTQLNSVIGNLSLTGGFRQSHRVPPGFQDRKEENASGDAIIWEEILHDIGVSEEPDRRVSHSALLMSRDRKTDWVSAAPYVKTPSGETRKSNRELELDVTLPHPLLVHEFVTRAPGKRLYVAHPGVVATVLHHGARQRGEPSGIEHWLNASHPPGFTAPLEERSRSSRRDGPASKMPVGTQNGEVPRPPVTSSGAASSTSDIAFENDNAQSVMAPSVASEVRSYQDALPREQSALLADWTESVRAGTKSPYALGRILGDLSLNKAPGWPDQLLEFVEYLSREFDVGLLNAVALAVVTAVYFDRYGQLLTRPHLTLGSIGLSLESDRRLEPAFRCLNRFLTQADANLPYVPGSASRVIKYAIELEPAGGHAVRAVRDIRLSQHPALAHPVGKDSPRRLTAMLARSPEEGCKGRELRALVAREFLIPIGVLSSDLDDKNLTWLPDAGLVSLDTGAEGGLSALADEEDENE